MKRFAILILVAGACATVGKDFDESVVDQIVIGTTTRADVEGWLGKPNDQASLSGAANGGTLRYTYKYAHAVGFGKATAKALVVDFDANGVAVEKAYSSQ